MDGGEEEDGTRRHDVAVAPPVVQPHVEQEQARATVENRMPALGSAVYRDVALTGSFQSTFPLYRQRSSFHCLGGAPQPVADDARPRLVPVPDAMKGPKVVAWNLAREANCTDEQIDAVALRLTAGEHVALVGEHLRAGRQQLRVLRVTPLQRSQLGPRMYAPSSTAGRPAHLLSPLP